MLNGKYYCDYETCVALKELGYIGQGGHYYVLPEERFPEVTFENSPMEVELKLIEKCVSK